MDTESKEKPEKPAQSDAWSGWENRVWEFLMRAMQRRKISYKELSRRLEALDIYETPGQLNRKVNRKRFSAAFFLACCKALEIESIAFSKKS